VHDGLTTEVFSATILSASIDFIAR